MVNDIFRGKKFLACLVLAMIAPGIGCVKVGPDFTRPEAPVSQHWIEFADTSTGEESSIYRAWWQGFNDPELDRIIERAYRNNLSLKIAGLRVLEARALLGIAIGRFFPQDQRLTGFLEYNRVSEHSFQAGALLNQVYAQSQAAVEATWELDFWGKYRRNIESADANWKATLADYDNALVSLTADAANSYISIRTLEKRIEIARQNIETQTESLNIASARYEAGISSERDVEQARAQLANTKAVIPALESQLRQAKNALSVLIGILPADFDGLISAGADIPVPPLQVAVGIPADLIRRRPDIRSAEYQAASQSAQIGVAKADLLPALSLAGTFGFVSTDVGKSSLSDIFKWESRQYTWGPQFQWTILNYGRIINNVRVQDARFQQLLTAYQNTVLKAQQEVEDALAGFLRSREQAEFLAESVGSARNSVRIGLAQYQEGVADYTTVITAQTVLFNAQDNLAITLGNMSRYLTSVYRALGGGWQIRESIEPVPDDMKQSMKQRTYWGDLLKPAIYVPRY
ncbi:MAG: efflux transporter outer membrane subunit [Syntrophorhabdaceae bacterium]